MKGYVEVKEDIYEDTIEHLRRIKTIACKLMKKLEEHSELYGHEEDEDDEIEVHRVHKGKGRYSY